MSTRSSGFVLVVVLVFGLLLSASVATLARRAVVDSMIVRNRDRSAQAEALARGGLRLATALLLEDRLREQDEAFRAETRADLWARAAEAPTETADGGRLRLRIEDAGARLNLNALVREGERIDDAEALLEAVLEVVIDQMPLPPEEKFYDREELARSLIDYIDADRIDRVGGSEDDPRQQPPTRAANRPLLSVGELRQVAGFDAALVDALRPYVTVYPYTGGRGINPNTAPPHVLALLYLCEATGSCRRAGEDAVRDVLRARQREELLCASDAGPECTSIREVIPEAIVPAPAYESDVFFVNAEARVGAITRTLEAVVDRSDPAEPRLLSWRMR